jgi:hypothetical protein
MPNERAPGQSAPEPGDVKVVTNAIGPDRYRRVADRPGHDAAVSRIAGVSGTALHNSAAGHSVPHSPENRWPG